MVRISSPFAPKTVSIVWERLTGKMLLNENGLLAEQFWLQIPIQFSFIDIGNFVVMPNHVHGILIINNANIVETRLIAFHSPTKN